MLSRLGWLALYAVLACAPVLALFVGERPFGLGWRTDAALALGFAGVSTMALQFVLTARFKRAADPFGIDILYYFHRSLAVVATGIVLAHPVVLLVETPALLVYLDPRVAPLHMTAGVISVASLVVLMLTSWLRKRIRLEYDRWRRLHLALAIVAVAGAWWHVREVNYYAAQPAVGWTVDVIAASLVAVVAYVRVWRPWRMTQRPYTVVRTSAERGDATTLVLAPRGHAGLRFEPGQFVWVTMQASAWAMREHPFSISSAPRADGQVEVTIKALGDFTSRVRDMRQGTTALVDGPYGAFSIDRHPADAYAFIAGGIGIAPIMSCLRAMADRGDVRPVQVFYAYRVWDRLTFREALEALRERLVLDLVFVLDEPDDGWTGERGRIDQRLLERRLPPQPDRGRREYFVCGPTAMLSTVERALVACGVPAGRVRSEIFDIA